MTTKILCFATLLFVASICCVAAHAVPQASSQQAQQFTVLHTGHMVVATETPTNDDAHCSIMGASNAATMQCRPSGVTAKASYHFNTALVVDSSGAAYVIACRVPLVSVMCAKLDPGSAFEGRMDKGTLSINDGTRVRRYQILTSANVGPLPVSQLPPATPSRSPAARVRSEPPPAVAPAAPAPPDNLSAGCESSTSACVTFASDPQGADIYVDGKFVGSTPSMIILAAGSHELRIQAETFTPWTRTFEASAGSKVSIRATLQSQSPRK